MSHVHRKPAAHRGSHKGFLAAALISSLLTGVCYIGNVIMAGTVGGIQNRHIFLPARGLPGVIALVLVF